ncbi:amidohydrolase family protein [Olsenella phocaeensis]|uniref:amidohydrolase family protein n=1 Tax=Olsenella phocaeensis TaxID=1852385 RepID=UPI000A671DAB|nr:amidohydrolase family protein [Olsenella phocaeensis]
MIDIIDTHVHVWDLGRYRLPWLDGEGPVLRRTWTVMDYLRESGRGEDYRLEQAVYIEVDMARYERERECELACGLVDDDSTPFGGACISGDLSSPEFESYIRLWSKRPQVKGVRQVLHVPSADPGTCLTDRFVKNVRLLGELGLVFEGCVRCAELADLATLARECPDTTIVLNHMGIVDADIMAHTRPTADEAAYQNIWKKNMAELGKLPNVVCKVSGLNPMEAWSSDSLARSVDVALDAFDSKMVMYASNFPVLNVALSFDEWTRAVLEMTSTLDGEDRKALFSKNAKRVYRL